MRCARGAGVAGEGDCFFAMCIAKADAIPRGRLLLILSIESAVIKQRSYFTIKRNRQTNLRIKRQNKKAAIAAAIAACACREGVTVKDSRCVEKSYPKFWEDLRQLKGEEL